MSKIGKIPIVLKEEVSAVLENGKIVVTGAKGTLSYIIPSGINVTVSDGKIQVSADKKSQEETKAVFGLTRSLIANLVKGVTEGFQKKLELTGVGYRALTQGNDLVISVGFSHPVKVSAPEGIQFTVSENTIIISGIDKGLVGNIAARIRAIRKPEPYKGKGIKYAGERIRRKAGKAAKAVGGVK